MKAIAAVLVVVMTFVIGGNAGAQNVDYVSETLFGGSFNSIKIVGDFAYAVGVSNLGIGTGEGCLQILSMVVPAKPLSYGGCFLPAEGTDVFISGENAYVSIGDINSSESIGGIIVIDLTCTFPATIVGSYETNRPFGDIYISGDYAVASVENNEIMIFDISNPADMTPIGNYSTTIQDIYALGDYVYIVDYSNSLLIIDISDPTDPVFSGSCTMPDSTYGLYVLNNYAYVACGSNGGLQIIDISNQENPYIIGGCDVPAYAIDVYATDYYAYLVTFTGLTSGLSVVDISNPSNPVPVWHFNSDDEVYYITGNEFYSILWRPQLAYQDDTPPSSVFYVFDVADPEYPVPIGYNQSNAPSGIFIEGTYTYGASGGFSFQVLDNSNPINPVPLGSHYTEYEVLDVAITGNYALSAWGHCTPYHHCFGGLEIVDIYDPSNPVLTGSIDAGGRAIDIFISGNHAYITWHLFRQSPRFDIIDFSDPENPSLIYRYDDSMQDVVVEGDFAFVARSNFGLEILNISDPASPILAGSLDLPGIDFRGIDLENNNGYFAVGDSGLFIYDLTDPTSPQFLGDYETQGFTGGVFVSGDYAFLSVSFDTLNLLAIDVSDPMNPILAGSYDSPGYIQEIFIENDYLYVADGSSFLILRFDPQSGIIEEVTVPRQYDLAPNYPNPFNASTVISYSLPYASDVKVDIYDILGRLAHTIQDGVQLAGNHQVIWNAGDLPSGIYFYKLQAGDHTETRKMVLLK